MNEKNVFFHVHLSHAQLVLCITIDLSAFIRGKETESLCLSRTKNEAKKTFEVSFVCPS